MSWVPGQGQKSSRTSADHSWCNKQTWRFHRLLHCPQSDTGPLGSQTAPWKRKRQTSLEGLMLVFCIFTIYSFWQVRGKIHLHHNKRLDVQHTELSASGRRFLDSLSHWFMKSKWKESCLKTSAFTSTMSFFRSQQNMNNKRGIPSGVWWQCVTTMDVHHPIIRFHSSHFLLCLSYHYCLSLLVPLSLTPNPLILSLKATWRPEGVLAGGDRGI